MIDCTRTLTDRCLERYIQGTLPELEAQQFEEHYFECPDCLAQAEALQALTRRLGTQSRMPVMAPIPWPVRVDTQAMFAGTETFPIRTRDSVVRETPRYLVTSVTERPLRPVTRHESVASEAGKDFAANAINGAAAILKCDESQTTSD
jgi:anti-sigma factor RsiW